MCIKELSTLEWSRPMISSLGGGGGMLFVRFDMVFARSKVYVNEVVFHPPHCVVCQVHEVVLLSVRQFFFRHVARWLLTQGSMEHYHGQALGGN